MNLPPLVPINALKTFATLRKKVRKATQTCVIWLRKNGTDITGTASKFDVPSKHGSSDGYLIAACNFYVDLAEGDHLELWAASSSTTVYFEAYAAQTSPYARPSIPSVVVTLSFVSN